MSPLILPPVELQLKMMSLHGGCPRHHPDVQNEAALAALHMHASR